MLTAMTAMLTKLADCAGNDSWLCWLVLLASYTGKLCYIAMRSAHAGRHDMLAVLLGNVAYALWLSCLPIPMVMLNVLGGYVGYPGWICCLYSLLSRLCCLDMLLRLNA
jgi:hypothetical protein